VAEGPIADFHASAFGTPKILVPGGDQWRPGRSCPVRPAFLTMVVSTVLVNLCTDKWFRVAGVCGGLLYKPAAGRRVSIFADVYADSARTEACP